MPEVGTSCPSLFTRLVTIAHSVLIVTQGAMMDCAPKKEKTQSNITKPQWLSFPPYLQVQVQVHHRHRRNMIWKQLKMKEELTQDQLLHPTLYFGIFQDGDS